MIQAGVFLVLHFLLAETTLGVIGLLGAVDALVLNATLGTVLQGVAVGIALIVWSLLSCCGPNGNVLTECCFEDDPERRGSGLVKARVLYFFGSLVLHVISLVGWIVYSSMYANLDPISATDNVAAYIARGNLHLMQLVVWLLMFAILVVDWRALKHKNKKQSTVNT